MKVKAVSQTQVENTELPKLDNVLCPNCVDRNTKLCTANFFRLLEKAKGDLCLNTALLRQYLFLGVFLR